MADSEGSIFAKLRAFAARDWILIALSVVGLVIAYFIWRNSQAQSVSSALGSSGATDTSSAGYVPSGGSGQPIWPTDGSGQNQAFWEAFMNYIQNNQTPNPPSPSTPTTPTSTSGGLYITANGSQTLNQIAQAHGTTATNIVYSGGNAQLKALLEALHIPFTGQKGYGTYTPKAGTQIYIPNASMVVPTHGRNPNDPIGFQ